MIRGRYDPDESFLVIKCGCAAGGLEQKTRIFSAEKLMINMRLNSNSCNVTARIIALEMVLARFREAVARAAHSQDMH